MSGQRAEIISKVLAIFVDLVVRGRHDDVRTAHLVIPGMLDRKPGAGGLAACADTA